jgi:glucokinase
MPVLAIDIGGTKLAAALVDSTGRLLGTTRMETPTTVDDEGLWQTLVSLLDRVRGAEEITGVGVGCGGPMQWPSGIVSPLNIPALRDFPLRERLSSYVPDVPVRVHNDAVALTVGEHWRGAGRGWDNVLGMVVSTGVGGGLVLGGHLVDGASGNAGHIGHVVVAADGPPCHCGGVGCLEAVARGPAVVSWARAHGWRDGAPGTAKDVAEDAQRGHPVALAALTRAGNAIGVALASAMHLVDVDVVCIGGGLAQAGPLLFTPIEEALRRHVGMPWAREVRVLAAAQGQDAGLVGAAALVLAGARYWSPAD